MESGFPAALEMFWYVRMVHLSVSIILTYRNVKCKAGNKDDINMILSWEKTTKLNSACSRTQTKILACNPDASFGSLAQELTKLFVILGAVDDSNTARKCNANSSWHNNHFYSNHHHPYHHLVGPPTVGLCLSVTARRFKRTGWILSLADASA